MITDKQTKKKYIIAGLISLLLIIILCVLFLLKKININQYLIKKDSAKGIDVSHYQGDIDWSVIRDQGVSFAFIKATEGSSYVDDFFAYNWEEAQKEGILTGAYHFFSFDSPAKSQAQLFIETVGDLSGHLGSVIDVEYYGDKEANPPSAELIIPELQKLLSLLEEQYHAKPIIYTTYKVYHKYLEGNFSDYPLWIRNVYYPPIDIDREWTFWQYSDTGRMPGMHGEEPNVDLNVFYKGEGALEEHVVQK